MKKLKILRKNSDKDFKPHMMYDPKTGRGYKANTLEDHKRMSKLGYVHEKPSRTGMKSGVRGGLERSFSGENTTMVSKDKKGYYSLIDEDQSNGMNKGDTIRTDDKVLSKDKDYIIGGDYKAVKMGKKSYKRKKTQ
tara:strand:+ start:304 stop:711 length:408 start_codon:yes stop_codon:yes gene_type:complete